MKIQNSPRNPSEVVELQRRYEMLTGLPGDSGAELAGDGIQNAELLCSHHKITGIHDMATEYVRIYIYNDIYDIF